MIEGPKFVFTSNYSWKCFGNVAEWNAFLKAILHIVGIVEGLNFAFESAMAALEVILQINMRLAIV